MKNDMFMRRVYAGLIGTALVLMTFFAVNSVNAARPTITEGVCYNGAPWELQLNRKGAVVTATYTVTGLRKQQWNVNWAWVPINTVYNQSVYPKKNKIVVTHRVISTEPVTVFVYIDEAWANTITCAAGGTI